MKSILLSFLVMLTCVSGFAQNAIVTIWGKVTEANGTAVASASVRMSDSNIGTVTNSEGVFSLKLPADQISGKVSVQCLGFALWEQPLSAFATSSEESPLRIKLVPITLTLNPASIHSVDPLVLLQYAYSKVKQNYPQDTEIMTAFYREKIRKGQSKYLSLSEAVIDIDKASYNGFGTDRAKIYKGRTASNYERSDSLLVNYQGGVTSSLAIDQVKDPFARVAYHEISKYYDFRMEDPVMLGDRTFYVISFDQKKGLDDFFCRGKVYIDSDSYAIGRVETFDNVENDPYAYRYYINSKTNGISVRMRQVGSVVTYKESNGRWYLDYSSITISFDARKSRTPWRQTYTISSEMAMTDHYPGDRHITNDVRIRQRDLISELVADFTDEEFWGTYNIIEPDQTIDDAVRRIIRKLKRH